MHLGALPSHAMTQEIVDELMKAENDARALEGVGTRIGGNEATATSVHPRATHCLTG